MNNDDLLFDPDLGLVADLASPEKMARPSKRWHNKWRAPVAGPVFRADDSLLIAFIRAGDEYFDDFEWPSKEVAEQRAHDEIAEINGSDGDWIAGDYVGAFPVDGDA